MFLLNFENMLEEGGYDWLFLFFFLIIFFLNRIWLRDFKRLVLYVVFGVGI